MVWAVASFHTAPSTPATTLGHARHPAVCTKGSFASRGSQLPVGSSAVLSLQGLQATVWPTDGRNYTSDCSTCRLKALSPYPRCVVSVGTEYPVISQGAGIHLHSCVALQTLAAFSKVCVCAFRGQGPYLPFSSL